MVPRRLDRSEIRIRLDQVEAWVLDDFMDAFEAAALAAMAEDRKTPEAQSDG